YEELEVYYYKASKQLDKGINTIKREGELLEKLGITEIETVKIYPLIVSTSFDSDDIIFHKQYLKISYFELLIILRNDLKSLLTEKMYPDISEELAFSATLSFENRGHPHFNPKRDYEIGDTDLWNGNTECSVQNVIEAIEENKIWNSIPNVFNYNHKYNIRLCEFENMYKLLELKN
ncbi:MAG: hypothetical protein AAF518_17965, partial [Spirochaetota bacterium]